MAETVTPSAETSQLRLEFFKALFGNEKGFIALQAIGRKHKGEKPPVEQKFFEYPEQLDQTDGWIESKHSSKNVYFSPMLYKEAKRLKVNVKVCPCIWADMDAGDWRDIKPKPSIVVKSSEGKHHLYWILKEPAIPDRASEAARRIAYHYKNLGMDQSGWDLSQLLRIPETYNLKYMTDDETPVVKIVESNLERTYVVDDFLAMLAPVAVELSTMLPMPDKFPQETPEQILKRYGNSISREVFQLYKLPLEDTDDWSTPLWKLECSLFEAGLTHPEVFIIAKYAACNKYRRDERPDEHLWNEVCKAADAVTWKSKEFNDFVQSDVPSEVSLLTDEERKNLRNDTFIDKYTKWASDLTDADPRFHHLTGFIILSLLLSHALRIRTNVDDWRTNIWGLILADTTLARKSTSMRLGMKLVNRVNKEVFMASDGSPEGIAEAVAERPGKPSLFMRDEFSGLLIKMQNERSHQGNFMQFLTSLYDADTQKRRLRNKEVNIVEPILVVFGGGVIGKVLEVADAETITSGFFPRFIFAISEQPSKDRSFKSLRPQARDDNKEDELVAFLERMHESYSDNMTIKLKTGHTIAGPKMWYVNPTDEAWDRYDLLVETMLKAVSDSPYADILEAIVERLGGSILKCAALLAAADTVPAPKDAKIELKLEHLLKVISYGENWLKGAFAVCTKAGITVAERQIEKIWEIVKRNPGVSRGEIMRRFRLLSNHADLIMNTMEQRGMIVVERVGKGMKYYTPDWKVQ